MRVKKEQRVEKAPRVMKEKRDRKGCVASKEHVAHAATHVKDFQEMKEKKV